jgi:hypothetical protein
LPVPDGFVACPKTSEREIREAYDELKIRMKTHFLAVRGPTHAVLNLVGPDPLIHALRRLWAESPDASVLIQRMVPSMWCGKAHADGRIVNITANEGLMIFDPDKYVFDREDGVCLRKSIEPRQRKMLRYVDGTLRTVEREGERPLLTDDQLKTVANLAVKADGKITWALDDQDRAWLISLQMG